MVWSDCRPSRDVAGMKFNIFLIVWGMLSVSISLFGLAIGFANAGLYFEYSTFTNGDLVVCVSALISGALLAVIGIVNVIKARVGET